MAKFDFITCKLSIFILLVLFFLGCGSSELTNEEREGLKIDHLTDVSDFDIRNRIKDLEIEIREMIRFRRSASREIELIENELQDRLQKADSVISDNKRTIFELNDRINGLKSSIIKQRQRLQTFKDRNTNQIRIEKLKSEIADIGRDIKLYQNPKLNDIEKNAIKSRYENIYYENKKSMDLGNESSENCYFIKFMLAWQDTLDKRLNEQVNEFEGHIYDFNFAITIDTNKIVDLSNQINFLEKGIISTKELIVSLKNDYARDSVSYRNKIESYKRNETILMAKRMTHEIVLLKKNIEIIPQPPEELIKKLDEINEFHKNLIDNLFKYDYDLLQEQFDLLTANIESINWKLKDIQDLEGLVKELFRNRVFTKFLALGDTIVESSPEYQKSIEEFNMHIYTVKRFLNLYPKNKIYIDGYADPLRIPSNPLYGNKNLSKQRVESAKRKLKSAGISDSNIVVDWFGEFHTQVSPEVVGVDGSPIDRRVEMRIIGPSDTSKAAKIYLKFKENNQLFSGDSKKSFRHESGFWIDNSLSKLPLDTIFIKYKSDLYLKLANKNSEFRNMIEPKSSPIFENGVLQLGNEAKFLLLIDSKYYCIILGENGAETFEDPRISFISDYFKE